MHKLLHALEFAAKVTVVVAVLKVSRAGTLGTTLQSLASTVS